MSCGTAATNASVEVATNECYFFRRDDAHSTFMALLKSGKYFEIDRGHMEISCLDRGTWSHDGPRILLRSQKRTKDITYDCLTVSGIIFSDKKDLTKLETAIRNLLASSSAAAFSRDLIEGVWKERVADDMSVSGIDVDLGVAAVQRQSLSFFCDLISKAKDDSDRNVLEMFFIQYAGRELLCRPDGSISSLELSREGKLLFTRVPQSEFLEATQSLQPFMFYPEMNRRDRTSPKCPELNEIYRECEPPRPAEPSSAGAPEGR